MHYTYLRASLLNNWVVTKITHVVYSGFGGQWSVVKNLIKDKDFEHSIVFYGVTKLDKVLESTCKELDLNFRYVPKKQGLDVSSWKVFLKALKTLQGDIVVLHSSNLAIPSLFYSMSNAIPFISVLHTTFNIYRKIDYFNLFLTSYFSHTIVVLSHGFQEMFNNYWFSFNSKKKQVIINNGVDVEKYSPRKIVDKNSEIVISTVGRLEKGKGIDILLDALAKVIAGSDSRMVLHIGGDGRNRKNLESRSVALGIQNNVKFLGVLNEMEIISLLRKTDIFVYPSQTDNFSMTLLEAMSCGLPVIASDIKEHDEILNKAKGVLRFKAGDVNSLSTSMAHLVGNFNSFKDLGVSNREVIIENFSKEIMTSKYANLYRQISSSN